MLTSYKNNEEDMGNQNQKIARIDVLIGGADQARKQTEEMRTQWASLGKVVSEAKKQMEGSTNTIDYDKNKKRYEEAMKEQKQVQKAILETERNINTVEKYLSDVSGQTLRNLNQGKKALSQMLLGINPKNLKALDTVRDYIKQIADEAQRRKGNLIEFSDVIGDIGNVSDKSLSQAKQRLQDLLASTKLNTQEMADYRAQLAQVEAEEKRRVGAKAGAVMGNLGGSSLTEIQDAIRATEQLRNEQKLGNQQWKTYNDEISRAKKYLEDYSKTESTLAMSDRMRDLGSASTASLEEMRKFWQVQVDGAKQGSLELNEYAANLKEIQAEEQKRAKVKAQTTLGKVQGGTFSGTIGETKEAIKELELFKQQLKTTDTTGIKQVDDAILLLNNNLKQASTAALSYDQAIEQAAQVKSGNFQGTYEDLERLKKTLKEYKSQLQVGDTRGLEDIQNAFRAIEEAEKKAKQEVIDIQSVMNNLKSVPMNDLQLAAKQLQEELNLASQNTEEFITKSAQLRQVNAQIESVNKQWKEHDNAVVRVIKRLGAYVVVYAGFNELWGKVKQLTQANLELSDSLGNIQKATGLSAEAVGELSREIDGIDTRESQKDLHDLAFEAGKLGITAKSDILAFVEAGNEVITALGDELGGAEAVRGLMKINDLLGETARLGVGQALKATGSSINELANSCTASAGPIADIISRLGAVGAASKLSMADLAAMGATADGLSQEIEVSGTALSKFITAMQTNTRGIAQAVGVDDEEIQKLMDAGNTMEAIIMVLERMSGKGMKEIAPLMKEFGSDGERLNKIITAFADNVDVLKQRVDTSRTAFEEATSVTKEYNVMNETAMALLQRMGNTMTEAFVNSGFVASIKSLLLFFMDLPSWIERNRIAFIALKVVLAEILLMIAARNWSLFLTTLKSIGAFIAGPFIAGWKALRIQIVAAEMQLALAGTTTVGLTGKIKVLWAVIKANPLGIILTILTAVGVAMYDMATHVSATAKATSDYNAQLVKERLELDALFAGLSNNNLAMSEKKKLIDEINSRYSSYLGFMLSEKSSADKLAAAHDLINAKLRERLALQLQEKMNERSAEKLAGSVQGTTTGLQQTLSSSQYITGARMKEAMELIRNTIFENIDKGSDEISAKVKDKLVSQFKTPSWRGYGISLYRDLDKDLSGLIKSQKEYNQEVKDAADYVKSDLAIVNKQAMESNVKLLNSITKEYDALVASSKSATKGEDIETINNKRIAKAQEYITIAKKQMESVTGEQQKYLQTAIESYTKIITELTPKNAKQINVWGEGLSLEKASVEQLVGKYKELFDERKTMREDAQFDTVYSKQFTDRKEAMAWYMSELKKIQSQLNKMGYNEKGNFLKEKVERARSVSFGGVTKTEKEVKEESAAALSALEAYYNKEKEIITRAFVEKQMTEEEKNRQLLKTEEMFLADRIALRRKLLDKKGGEQFEKSKYVHTSPETGDVTDYFKGKNLNQLQGFIKQMGQRMTDGMLNQLTEDELLIMQKAAEHMAKIQKIILDNDFSAQVDKQYQDELESLELFWGKEEAVTIESGEKRLAYLRMLSKDSYNMDSAGLQERMDKYGEFGEWMQGRTAEDYQALLLMLQKYYDDSEESENKEIARKQRIADKKWEKTGAKTAWDTSEKQSEQNVGFTKNLNELGIASDSDVQDAELKMYETRLLAAQAYYDFVMSEGGNVVEAEKARSEAYQDLANQEMEITKSKMQTLKGYTDAVVDFSGQMGEAAFGEVKDRQDAGKQLLRITMQLTKNLIMEKLKELIMKKALGSQDLAITQSTESAKSLAQGTGAIGDLTVQGTKLAADVPLAVASGGAKAISQLGPWGIPLIAVIGAALSALMGMAMGSMNKAKDEIAATTGASNKGRVAAGMLTYKDGDYPVLGNDGQIYNASYQRELKTGVYGGGAHFGIFSEKKPEMIVDGDTTQRIMLNYPQVYESILTIAKHGRMKSSMQTYASGNYPAIPASAGVAGTNTGEMDSSSAEMKELMTGLTETLAALNARLQQPINAVVDPYGSKGAVNALGKANQFMARRNLIK